MTQEEINKAVETNLNALFHYAKLEEDSFRVGFTLGAQWAQKQLDQEWHKCAENTEDVPAPNTTCLLRVEYIEKSDSEQQYVFLTATWHPYEWKSAFLDLVVNSVKSYKITHWKAIVEPK